VDLRFTHSRVCWVRDSHGRQYEEYGLVGCNSLYVVRGQPDVSEEHITSMFRIQELSLLSSPPAYAGSLIGLIILMRGRYFPPKYTTLQSRRPYTKQLKKFRTP
jgi:hypothetical protein